MSKRQPPRAVNPAARPPVVHHPDRNSPGTKPNAAMGPARRVADTAADFDGSATEDLVRAVGLLLANCGSEASLGLLARELATNVERRDALNAIAQLRWRLDELGQLHSREIECRGRR